MMSSPATYRVVDGAGTVVRAGLTSSACDELMRILLEGGRYTGGLRSEPMPTSAAAPTPQAQTVPRIVAEMRATERLDIEPGRERDVLREAINAHAEAETAVEAAQEGVDRVKRYRQMCEQELATLQTKDEHEIAAAGAALAERLKSGEAPPLEPSLGTGRLAILDAEGRLAAAVEACVMLDSDLAAAKQARDAAAGSLKLAVTAVIRADRETWVSEAEELWGRLGVLRNLVESARYVDVPCDTRAVAALRGREYAIDRHADLLAYQRGLMLDADVRFDDQGTL